MLGAACTDPIEMNHAGTSDETERQGTWGPPVSMDALTDLDLSDSLATVDLQPPTPDAKLLVERVRFMDGKSVSAASDLGELSLEAELRAARPYRHLHEDTIYEEVSWSVFHEGDVSEHGVRVWARPNPKPAADPLTLPASLPGPPVLDDRASALLQPEGAWPENGRQFFTLTLRGYPEWDVPLRPRVTHLSEARAEAQQAFRTQRLAERAALYDELTADLFSTVESLGGHVAYRAETSGYAIVQVDREGLLELSKRNDLRAISVDDGASEPGWPLGAGKEDAKVDAGDLVDAGYDGEGIKIAIVEHGHFRNRACGFKNGANCTGTSRIEKMYDCEALASAPFCSLVPASSEFPDPFAADDDGDHGTSVTALALADYTENQAEGFFCGDTTTTHSSTWESNATGYAPEATALYYGNIGQTPLSGRVPRHQAAFGLAVEDGADIVNFSQGTGQRCHPRADVASEKAAEDAFDDGVLFAACTGNHPWDGDGEDVPTFKCVQECGTWSVGSLAKTMAIAGFRSQDAACNTNYADCRLDYCMAFSGGYCADAVSACRGGADVSIAGITRVGAASLTDLLMPTAVTSSTVYGPDGLFDEKRGLVSTAGAGGCSSATPQFAGLAATIKEYYLATGLTWIDAPGRFQALLLSLGDRSHATINDGSDPIYTRTAGTSPTWGLGRVRARRWNVPDLAPALATNFVKSYTPSSTAETFRPFLFSTPLPTGVELVKCTLLQIEDFSEEAADPVTISDIDLKLELRDPSGGTCSVTGSGQTLRATRSDNSSDWKKMVAFAAPSTTLAGRCAYVTLTPAHVEAEGLTAVLSCTYVGALESDGGAP